MHIGPVGSVAGIEIGAAILIGSLVIAAAAVTVALISPVPGAPDPNDRESTDERASAIADSAANRVAQGHVGPVIFGEVVTGSVVVSSGVQITEQTTNYFGFGNGSTGINIGTGGRRYWTSEGWNFNLPKGGKSGGGQARAAQEDPNTLQSNAIVRTLEVIAVGENEGLVDGLKSVALDGTAIENEDGSLNFPGFAIDVRNGSENQSYIEGFPGQEATINKSIQISQSGGPVVHTITDEDIDSARVTLRLNSLYKQDTTNGDLKFHQVECDIEVQSDGGGFASIFTGTRRAYFNGKCTSPYQRDYAVNLPAGGAPWDIRITRRSSDTEAVNLQDDTYLDFVTEVTDVKLNWPGVAHVGLTANIKQLGTQVKKRSYHWRGLRIQVPTNFDPVTRVYTGQWDGTFKTVYSDCPAWCLYALATNDFWGAGQLTQGRVDPWSFYEASKYCAVQVPDGQGGTEPRYRLSAIIQTRSQAIKLFNMVASVFRGAVYWGSEGLTVTQDRPDVDENKPIIVPANTGKARINYDEKEAADQFSAVIVWWNDVNEGYGLKPHIEPDNDLIRKIGFETKEITAWGAPSLGQAVRMARWEHEDQASKARNANIPVGPDQAFTEIGRIVKVHDDRYTVNSMGGRLADRTLTTLTLDRVVTLEAGHSYTVTAVMPNGNAEIKPVASSTVVQVDGEDSHSILTVSEAFSALPVVDGVWALESDELSMRQFRVQGKQDQDMGAMIRGEAHDPNSYDRVELNINIEPESYTDLPSGALTGIPDNSISVLEYQKIDGDSSVPSVRISWSLSRDPRVTHYDVEVREPGSEGYTRLSGNDENARDFESISAGELNVRVRPVDSLNRTGGWSEQTFTLLAGTGTLPTVTNLAVRADNEAMQTWLDWNIPTDVRPFKYEIYQGVPTDMANAVLIGQSSRRQQIITEAGNYFVRTAYMDVRSDASAIVVTEGDLANPEWSRVEGRPQSLSDLDPAGTAAINGSISTLNQGIIDANNAINTAEANAQSARNTLAAEAATARGTIQQEAASARDIISDSLEGLSGAIRPDALILDFDEQQSVWAYSNRENPPSYVESLPTEASFDTTGDRGTELVIDGAFRVFYLRNPFVFDRDNPRIYQISAEFKVDRPSTTGTTGDRLRFYGFLLNSEYRDASANNNGVAVTVAIDENAGPDGWTRASVKISTGANSLPGIDDWFGHDADYTPDLSQYVRFGIGLNHSNGDGQMRARNPEITDITEVYNAENRASALITAEEQTRISEDAALASSISTLSTRTAGTESAIINIQNTKADQTALTAEAGRIDALTSRTDSAEATIAVLQNTKADQSALTAEASRISLIEAKTSDVIPPGINYNVSGSISFRANENTTGPNSGEFVVTAGELEHPDIATPVAIPFQGVTTAYDGANIPSGATTFYILWTQEDGATRFTNGEPGPFAVVYYDASGSEWRVFEANSSASNPLTVRDSDRLIAIGRKQSGDNGIGSMTSLVNYTGAASRITTLETTKADQTALNTEASRIDNLNSRTGVVESDITSLQNTKADASALTTEASRIDGLTSRMGTVEGETSSLQSSINSLQSTKADASALTTEASRIDSLTSRVTTAEGGLSSAQSNITTLQNTKADQSALTAEAGRIDALDSRTGAAEGRITTVENTKANAIDLTAEVSRTSRLMASLSADSQNLYFDADQTNWWRHREYAPSATADALPASVSFDDDPAEGRQLILDGEETTFISRFVIPFDRESPRVYRFSGEYKVDREDATSGISASRILTIVYGLKGDYTDASSDGSIVTTLAAFSSATPNPATGWSEFEWRVYSGETAHSGALDYLGADPQYDTTRLHYLRFGFQLNYNNGDGKMRARNFRIQDITDAVDNQALIVSETNARVAADAAFTTSLNTLSSRTDATESSISSLQTTKADQSALATEAGRIDTLTSRVTTTEGSISQVNADIATLQTTKADATALTAESERISRVSASISGTVRHIALNPRADQNDWCISSSINGGDRDLSNGYMFYDPLPSDVTVDVVNGNPEIVFDGTERTFFARDTVDFSPSRPRLYKITCQIKYERSSSNTTDRLLLGAWYLADDYSTPGSVSAAEDLVSGSAVGNDWTDIEWLFAASLDPVDGFTHIQDPDLAVDDLRKIRFGGQGVYNNGDGKMRLRNFVVTEITDTAIPNIAGTITTIEAVTLEVQGRVQAHWQNETSVNGFAGTFISARTTEADGTVDSEVSIGAREFGVYNLSNDQWVKAMSVTGGDATFFGNLNALGKMTFGTRKIPLALQSFPISGLQDGDVIDFGGDLTNIPDYVIDTTTLAPLSSGQQYDVALTNLTSTGGTLRAKVTTPGTNSTYTSTGSTSGSGSEPDVVLHKSNVSDATNGDYKFTVSVDILISGAFGNEGGSNGQQEFGEEGFGSAELEFFVNPDGGSWTSLGTSFIFESHPTNGIQTYSRAITKNFANLIGQHSDQEFGVSLNNPNSGEEVNSFTVQWTSTSQSGTASATPNGETCRVTILPQNA